MEECAWREEDGVWDTDCMNVFDVTFGGPAENGMIYCCFCGKKIKEFAEEEQIC